MTLSVEDAARELKEQEIEIFREKCKLAAVALPCGHKKTLTKIWACSVHYLNTLARMWQTFPAEEIHPAYPIDIYNAALATDSPTKWLVRAKDEGWSSRQLKDAADISKGRHKSRVPWLKCRARPERQEGGVLLRFEGEFEPSGETPKLVEVRAVEVFEK